MNLSKPASSCTEGKKKPDKAKYLLFAPPGRRLLHPHAETESESGVIFYQEPGWGHSFAGADPKFN